MFGDINEDILLYLNKYKDWRWKLKGTQFPGITLLKTQLECWNFGIVCVLHVDHNETGTTYTIGKIKKFKVSPHTYIHTPVGKKTDIINKEQNALRQG